MIKTYNDYKDIQAQDRDAVVVIGNFDGVHRGHQILVARAREKALEMGKKLAVLTFSPHPREVFKADEKPFRLSDDAQKQFLLGEICQVDILYTLSFTKEFASISADDFINQVLIQGLGAAHIVIGHDFCFGKMRGGNAQTLKNHPELNVSIIDVLSDEKGTVFSSSEIRNALRRGDVDTANDLLGWKWYIEGEVVHGDKRGRELGYPTANMSLGRFLVPAFGIYAVRVQIEGDDTWYQGASNIGIRPMFRSEVPLCETFIFDFDQDIYGKNIKVMPVKFLRGEAKFESLDALIIQMEKDCKKAREILS